jgi:hypothetical protein
MTERETIQTTMQAQVKKYLDGHTEKWNNIPAIVRYKNTLDANLQAIKEKEAEAGQSTRPITESKNDLKQTAALKAAILAGALAAYAAEQDDKVLADTANVTVSGLFKLADRTFAAPIEQLIAKAIGLLTELADQGVTEDQLTELTTALDDFNELVGNPRTSRINTALANRQVSELVSDNQTLLNDKVDKTMLRYRLIDPVFYEGYERSRVMVG